MPRIFDKAPRRWIRHFRDLRNLRRLFPTGSADPSAPQVISPWLSDIVQPVFQITPDFRVFPVAQPAVATDFALVVPEGVTFDLLSIRATLLTDANVATRVVRLFVTSTIGQVVFHSSAVSTHPASLVAAYCAAGYGYDFGVLSSIRSIPLPQHLWLRQGFILSFSTENIQAGDQWSAITAQVAAWPEI